MENFLKQHGLALVIYMVTCAIAYGQISEKITSVRAVQIENSQYVSQFIETRTEVKALKTEVERSRGVWEKLDTTLDQLRLTLIEQRTEIAVLKEDVKAIKEAVTE